MVDRRLILAMTVLLAGVGEACGDDGGEGATPDLDAGVDADDTGVDAVDGDAGGVDLSYDGWIDGSYGDGRETPPPENCTDGLDNDEDGQTDCADDDCSGRIVCEGPQTAETEPNNRADDGQTLTLPALAAGDIAAPTEDADGNPVEDVDWYRFSVEAPTLVDLAFDDVSGPAIPILTLVGLEDATRSVVRQLDSDTPGNRRQAYLPVAGQYGIEVRDRRNTRRSSDELPYGGDGYDYVFQLTEATLEPEARALPIEPEPAVLGAGNALPVFAIDLSAGSVFEGEVWAERLTPSSGLDAMIYLVNRADSGVLGYIDDAPLDTYDPLLRTGILGADYSALLIVDAYRIEYTTDYELSAGEVEPSLDREPNNPIGLAYPAEVGVPIDGQVEAPFLRFRNVVTDTDYYWFPGGRSASYLIEVTPQGGDIDVSVRTGYRAYSGGVGFLAEIFLADPPDTRGVRLEATSLVNAAFFVEVDDRRNRLEEEADPVGGGSGYDYQLRVTPFTRSIESVELPLAASAELSLPGETDWYEFTAPARTRIEVTAEEVNEGVEPFVYLTYQNDAILLRGSRGSHYLNNAERAYRVGVVDRRAGGGNDYDYDLTIEAPGFRSVGESEPNDGPPEGGQILGAPDVWVDGTLTGANRDDYDRDVYVVNLQAGDRVFIETGAGADDGTDNADTTLELTGPGFDEPLVDADSGFGWYATILDLEVAESGAYEIAVTPWCNADGCRAGDYALAVWAR